MKIIDILVAKANGTLEDSFEFKYDENIYIFIKKDNRLANKDCIFYIEKELGSRYRLDRCLNNEVEVIEHEKEIKEISIPCNLQLENEMLYEEYEKMNELVRAVNKLNKEEK